MSEREMAALRAAHRYRVGPADPSLDAAACPGGCTLAQAMGTCERPHGHWCAGYGAMVCEPAVQAWLAAGRPCLTDAALRARLGPRPEPPPPALVSRAPATLPAVLQGVPTTTDGWELYATGADREHQAGLRAVVAGYSGRWTEVDRLPWLLLVGPPGTGKTFLLRIAAAQAAGDGLHVEWRDFTSFILACKAARDPGSAVTLEQVVGELLAADLVVLDDVRPVYGSADDENLCDLVVKACYGDDRGERRRGLWLSANLTVPEVQGVVGAAAMSRVLGAAAVFPCDWPAHPSRQNESYGGAR